MLSERLQRLQHPLHTYFQQRITHHSDAVTLLPRWRHPLIGYLVSLLLVGLGLGIGLVETQLLFPFSFPGVFLLFAVVIVAFLWGAMPALFAVLLSLLVLDYMYVPPFGDLGSYGWSGILQLFTFAGAGIIITILARQREIAYMKARANELALREANRRMETFLSIICHELKTPLTVMRGSLQLAERKVKRLVETDALGSDEMRQFAPVHALLERARSQITIQDRLVDDLLDIARVQTQALKLHKVRCNLVSIVQEAVEDLQQAEATRIILLEMAPEKDVPVHGDANRLVQVVTNYLTNALKYSPANQPVTVCLSVNGQMACVSVHDEGPGLPPGEHERVWECFYRVAGIEIQSGTGVGLGVGLHLCRTIIEQHNGQVGVESSPGKGSTFWFTLPLLEQDITDKAILI